MTRRGFTLVETVAAVAVISAALVMLTATVMSARRAGRAQAESALAWSLAAGAYERLRAAPPAELPGAEEKELPLPPAAARLKNARLAASCTQWGELPGLRRLRVAVSWKTRAGETRSAVCEGLVSDARAR